MPMEPVSFSVGLTIDIDTRLPANALAAAKAGSWPLFTVTLR